MFRACEANGGAFYQPVASAWRLAAYGKEPLSGWHLALSSFSELGTIGRKIERRKIPITHFSAFDLSAELKACATAKQGQDEKWADS